MFLVTTLEKLVKFEVYSSFCTLSFTHLSTMVVSAPFGEFHGLRITPERLHVAR